MDVINAIYLKRKKTSKSNVNCSVLGCCSARKRNNDLVYHSFPKAGEKILIRNSLSGKAELQDKLQLWETRARMGKEVTRFMKICSLHFKDEDYKFTGWSSRRFLRVTAVPSQNLPFNFSEVLKPEAVCKFEHTARMVNRDPWNRLGLKKECMFLIDLIKQHSGLDTTSIFLTLQKIRLAETFTKLGDDYDMSENAATNTFLKSVSLISELIGEFIVWHPKEKVQALLPASFQTDYSKVDCIINYLEIEIKTQTQMQNLTWSDYKQANTLKYLVSSTPDGVVNFISTAFGGRASDADVVKKSGFLNRLQPGTVVMAGQDFKHIEKLFSKKRCTLLKAPSVDVVRIHVTSVIRRLQEFNLLKNWSCVVTSKLTIYMDYITVIACGLINLQGPIM